MPTKENKKDLFYAKFNKKYNKVYKVESCKVVKLKVDKVERIKAGIRK